MSKQYLIRTFAFLKQQTAPRARMCLASMLCVCPLWGLYGQTQTSTIGSKIAAHTDFAVSATGEFTGSTSGPVVEAGAPDVGVNIGLSPSKTLGALVTLRFTKSAYVGAELNYEYARYSENFSNLVGSIITNPTIQTKASEFTIGYVAHFPTKIFGVSPFAVAGGGLMKFTPTSAGGLGYSAQGRPIYYVGGGAEAPIFGPHFGVRVQYRQVFFKAPDFFENYFTTGKRTSTAEPGVGFYLHF